MTTHEPDLGKQKTSQGSLTALFAGGSHFPKEETDSTGAVGQLLPVL